MNNSKILIVDDQLIGRQLLESVLFKENYELVFAEDGQKALDMVYEHQPDVVLLDVMMPQIDGFEVCRRVRNDESIKDTPIILVTALDDRDSRLKGFESGANDYISKPIDRLELLARVKNLTQMFRLMKESAGLEGIEKVTKVVETPQDFLSQINQFILQNENQDLKKYFPDFFEIIHQIGRNPGSISFTHEQSASIHLLYLQCGDEQFCNEMAILLNNLFPKAVHSLFEKGLTIAFKELTNDVDAYFQKRYQKRQTDKISLIWLDVNRNNHCLKLESLNVGTFLFTEDKSKEMLKKLGNGSINSFDCSDKVLFFPSILNGSMKIENLDNSNFSDLDSFITFLTEKQREIIIAGFTLS